MLAALRRWWSGGERPAGPVVVAAPEPAVDVLPRSLVTPEVLRALGWTGVNMWADALTDACILHGIHTRARLAAFLAQVGHESGGGRWVREIWGPTDAQRRYEGRRDLGNDQPGDGKRFLGRGLIQITGRANTTAARDALRPDLSLDAFCRWLETPEGAAESAAWWWAKRGLNVLADAGAFVTITRRINGGTNGAADRMARWKAAREALAA